MTAEQIPLYVSNWASRCQSNPAKSAHNLGVIFDKNFTFHSHASVACNSYFYHMWDLRRIRRHLDLDSAKLLATALASSCLDYCNSLLYGLLTLTSLFFSVNRINWPAWWQSLLHLLAVFHCFVPFIGCQYGLEYFLRSICWPPKPCMKNSLFIFIPCWLHWFLPVHRDQTMIIVCQSLVSRPILVLELFTLWNNLLLSVHSAILVATFKKHLNTHLSDLPFPP